MNRMFVIVCKYACPCDDSQPSFTDVSFLPQIYIRTLTMSSEVSIASEGTKVEGGSAVLPVGDKCTINLSLQNIDAKLELERLTDKLSKLNVAMDKLAKSMTAYSDKVPEDVRQRDQEKYQQQEVEKAKLEEIMSTLKKITSA